MLLLAVGVEDAVVLSSVEVDVEIAVEDLVVDAVSSPDPDAVVVVLLLYAAEVAGIVVFSAETLVVLVHVELLRVAVLAVHGQGDVESQVADALHDVLLCCWGGFGLT